MFDENLFKLGNLCNKNHEYENTGKSLIRIKNRWCNECIKEYRKKYEILNREKISKKQANYYELNKYDVLKTHKNYYELNKKTCLEQQKEHYNLTKEKNIEQHRLNGRRAYYRKKGIDYDKIKDTLPIFFSRSEEKIYQILESKNINFEMGKIFKDCLSPKGNYLVFDFYLLDIDTLIEYDGEQHFKSQKIFGGEKQFKLTQEYDEIKNEYCKSKGIELVRIKYNENIEKRLEEIKYVRS